MTGIGDDAALRGIAHRGTAPRGATRRGAIGGALGLGALALAGGGARAAGPVRVGSKIDTEGALLGSAILLLLAARGVPAVDRLQLGPTKVVRGALLAGEIDLYPEYTGNGAFFFGPETDPAWRDAGAALAKVRALDLERNGLVWLRPAPANNTWGVAVRRDLAEAERLASLADLAAYVGRGGRLRLAGSAEFVESEAALPAFQRAYGFKLAADQLLVLSGGGTAATLRAAAQGTSGVNAAMAYGTDGALAALDMVLLTDPRSVQPVYEPAPLVRRAALEAHPAIREALEPAFAAMGLEALQGLNAKIAVEGLDARAVAREFLVGRGLLRA